jgi:hypothetical protein
VFPRDVECFTCYSVPSVAVKYGTLEAAFEAVGIEARHLEAPLQTPHDVWRDRNEQTRRLIEGLQRLDETTHGDVTYTNVRNDPDLSINWTYYAFDSFSDAADVAEITDTDAHDPSVAGIDETQGGRSDSILDSMRAELKDPDNMKEEEH